MKFTMGIALLLTGCSAPNARVVTSLNHMAALYGVVPTDPTTWKVITSGLNPSESTMSTLFGNDTAVEYSRTTTQRNYPPGSVLALVTWSQQEDLRWFGARIPAHPKSVELVAVGPAYSYRSYEGAPLRETKTSQRHADERIAYFLSQRASVMP